MPFITPKTLQHQGDHATTFPADPFAYFMVHANLENKTTYHNLEGEDHSTAQHSKGPGQSSPVKTAADSTQREAEAGAHTTSRLERLVLQELLDAVGQLEGGLPTKLDDDALGPLLLNHIQHILNGQRLKVQPTAGVIVGGHSLWVAVHHDGLIPISPATFQQHQFNPTDAPKPILGLVPKTKTKTNTKTTSCHGGASLICLYASHGQLSKVVLQGC